jgi:RHS repeat-associated protein
VGTVLDEGTLLWPAPISRPMLVLVLAAEFLHRGLQVNYGSYCFQADGLGSVTSLTDPTGSVAATYTYDSFGFLTNSTGSATNWFRYTARQFDSDTALYYYRARYYDPTTGRFLSEDPARFSAGVDFYTYVGNSPPNFSDPSGLCPVPNKPTFTKRYLPQNAQTCSAILQFYAPPGFDLNAIVAAGKAGGLNPFTALAAVGHNGTFDFQRSRDS